MKVGERKLVGRFWIVWVICPICKKGREVQESRTKMGNFTGRCLKCYREIARQEISRLSGG